MPWKPSDAKTHLKDATPKQAVVWARVANAALTKCETDGGKDCEASAIKQANAAAGKIEESAHPVTFLNLDHVELTEADLSFGATERAIRAAIQSITPNVPGFYTWIRDCWANRFVYEHESPMGTELYQRTYTLNADGTVTLSDPVKVVQQVDYVPVGQPQQPTPPTGMPYTSVVNERTQESAAVQLSGDVIPLIEAAAKGLASGTTKLKVMSVGWGSSGYYPADVLKRDGATAFPAGTHQFLNHPTKQESAARPERDLLHIAAVTTKPAAFDENGPDGPGLYAESQVVPVHKPLISALAPHIGVSVRLSGKASIGDAEGKKGYIVESLIPSQHNSIDFVTRAGAGGKVLEIIESARGAQFPSIQEEDMELTEALAALEAEKTKNTALTEAQRKDSEELARLREEQILSLATVQVSEALGKSQFPDFVQDRLTRKLTANPPVKDGALDKETLTTRITEAVKEEADYLAKAKGSGRITGMGGGSDTSTSGDGAGSLEESMRRLGLSESASKVAAAGRN